MPLELRVGKERYKFNAEEGAQVVQFRNHRETITAVEINYEMYGLVPGRKGEERCVEVRDDDGEVDSSPISRVYAKYDEPASFYHNERITAKVVR